MNPLYIKLFLLAIPGLVLTQIISPLYSGGGSIYIPETNIVSSKALIAQYDVALAQADKVVQDAKNLKKDFTSFDETTKQTMEKMIPSKIDPIMFTDELTEMIKNENLPVSKFGQAESKAESQQYPGLGFSMVSFTVDGRYDDFRRVLKIIEGSLRLYEIESIRFTMSDKESEMSSMQVSAKTYFLK
jgi:hypothetical protein